MKPMYQRKRGLLRIAALGQVLIMVGAGCKSPPAKDGKGINDVSVSQALVGKDGSRTVTAANTVVNGYAALAANVSAGATSITVTDVDDFTNGTPARPALAVGDLVLIVQMAGATIDTTDAVEYGTVSNLNNAGRYEFAGVQALPGGNAITLSCGLKNSYTAAGKTQVVRVPQYTNLTIDSGASITADAWNGTVGGVVAVHAMNTITVTGDVDVSGKGFRGGVAHDGSGTNTLDVVTYLSSSGTTGGGMKGEGIAGNPNDDSFTDKYGRGAPANAGGGGNWHNAGGGGGANASAAGTWTGQGVMLSSVAGGGTAWALDLNPLASSPGGGRGGYTWSDQDRNATTEGPGDANWGGNDRRERGGLGGHPLTSSTGGTDARLFMGGGGGAGDGNNSVAGAGGPGGGLAFLIAGTVAGAGNIKADGAKGGDATATGSSDAAGGGGGGGTIVVHAGVLSGVHVSAKGGVGGSQVFGGTAGNEAEGPGGGGGGGFVALAGGTPASISVDGALGGTTNSAALTEFPSNGATAGRAGIADASAAALMYCTDHVAPNAIIIIKPSHPSNVQSPTFVFGAVEANSAVDAGDRAASFVCRLDDAPAFTPCPPTYIVPNLAEGTHTMRVRVVDLSGNDAGAGSEEIYTWRVDLTAPVPRIVTGPGGSASGGTTTSTTGSFTLNATERDSGVEIVTFRCRLDSNAGAFTDCTSTPNFTGLAEGPHTLDVRALDDAGNETAASDTVRWSWTVHAATDAGEDDDGGVGDAGAVDAAMSSSDANDTDARADTAGTVVLDAGSDRARDANGGADAGAVKDASVSTQDAASDGDAEDDEAGVGLDARNDARDALSGSMDASLPRDTGVAPSPDASVSSPDTAIQPPAKADAASTPNNDGYKFMGGGFCSMNPSGGGAPGLATLFLVVAFGLLVVRRRR